MTTTLKWLITSNDGDQVTLRRETVDALEESTIQRPDNTTPAAWKALWPVGLEMGSDEFHDRARFEAVRRKPVGVLTASENWAVERWNRPDRPIKQVEDVTESCRVFLENFGTEDMVGYARAVYLRYSTRPGIAADYAAINSEASLYEFIEKCENGAPRDTESLDELLKRAEHEGFWKGQQ